MQSKTHVKSLMYAGTFFLVILSLLAIAATLFVVKGNQSYDQNTISITGTAELDSAPDIAKFSFVVKETSDTTEEAQKIISKKISGILKGLEDLDVDESDIKTQSYTVYPKYEYVRIKEPQSETAPDGTVYFPGNNQKRIQTGFDVSQNVSVEIRDLDTVSGALLLFGEIGVDNLNGPNFTIDDPEGLQEEARKLAIEDAKKKAKRLANDLDIRLGKVVSFNENGGGYNPQPYYAKSARMDMAMMAEEVGFEPELPVGENTISANVTITYKLK